MPPAVPAALRLPVRSQVPSIVMATPTTARDGRPICRNSNGSSGRTPSSSAMSARRAPSNSRIRPTGLKTGIGVGRLGQQLAHYLEDIGGSDQPPGKDHDGPEPLTGLVGRDEAASIWP